MPAPRSGKICSRSEAREISLEALYILGEHRSGSYMSPMNWGAFDLNLLVVFDAVMQERSVTRAGSRIGLSQPAVSHALNRLRYMLKDQLFVRTPEGMVPTPRAEQLADPLRRALNDMQ